MEIKYKRKHNESFMIIENIEAVESFEKKMIEENEIGPLLRFSKIVIDGKDQYWYNISNKVTLKDYLEVEELTIDLLEKIILYLHLSCEEIGKYLIDVNHISISPETIYIEKDSLGFKVSLCYLPGFEKTIQEQFREVIEYLMTIASGDNRRLNEIIYGIYDKCLRNDYTLIELVEYISENSPLVTEVELPEDDFETLKDEESSNTLSEFYFEDDFEKLSLGERISDSFRNLFKRNEGAIKKASKSKTNELLKEDFVIEPDIEINEPTVLLRGEDLKCKGKLVYDGKDGEDDFLISTDNFKIGSEGTKNNAILHSKAVSHHHAKITKENDEYLLWDMNSTNGTFVNGKECYYKQPVRLSIMDKIRFADVSYVFM